MSGICKEGYRYAGIALKRVFARQSISRQFLVFAMLLIVSSSVVVGAYWTIASQVWLAERKISEIELTAHRAESEVVSYIRSISANLSFMVNNEAVRGIVLTYAANGSRQQWQLRLEKTFADMMEANPNLFQMRLIGSADGGLEIVRVERQGDRVVVQPQHLLQRKGDRDYFQEAIRLKEREIYFSSIDLNVERGKVVVPYIPTLRAASPVFDNQGRIFGIVIINANVESVLSRYAASLTSQGQRTYILGDKDQFLIHPEKSRTFGKDLGRAFGLRDQFARAGGEIAGWLEQDTLGEVNHIEQPDRLLSVIKTPMGFGHYLISIIETPSELIAADVRKGLLPSVIITLLLAMAGLVPALILAKLFSQPIRSLTHAARQISLGQHDEALFSSLPTAEENEVGQLSRAFIDMHHKLTDRQARLQDSSERLNAMVNASLSAIITIDQRGIIETVNERTLKMFGYSEDELIGSNVSMLMPSPHREHHDDYLRHHLETGERRVIGVGRELVARRKDESTFPIYLSVNRFVHGGQQMFTGMIMDISEQKLLRDTLASSSEIRRIMESTNDLFITTDKQYNINYINQRAAESLNIGHEIDGARLLDEIPELQGADVAGFMHTVAKGGEEHIELKLASPEGWFLVSGSSVGSSYYWQLVDITPLKKQQLMLEEQKRKLEQSNRELNDFAYVASHDLQEPLRKIQAFSDRLSRKYAQALDERGQDYLQRMNSAASRMRELIQSLLQLSRISSRQMAFELVDLKLVMEDVLEVLDAAIEEQQAKVTVGDLPIIEADPVQIRQLFQNLVGNALKYHDGQRPPEVSVSDTGSTPDQVEISVTDQGIGIDPEYAEKVFEPFERLHGREQFAGTGMGLAICRRIAERHNGLIRVEPGEHGVGSRFVVIFPKYQERGE